MKSARNPRHARLLSTRLLHSPRLLCLLRPGRLLHRRLLLLKSFPPLSRRLVLDLRLSRTSLRLRNPCSDRVLPRSRLILAKPRTRTTTSTPHTARAHSRTPLPSSKRCTTPSATKLKPRRVTISTAPSRNSRATLDSALSHLRRTITRLTTPRIPSAMHTAATTEALQATLLKLSSNRTPAFPSSDLPAALALLTSRPLVPRHSNQ